MQISIFDGQQKFKIDKPVRLIELFAGIGSQAKAFEILRERQGIEFENWRICEFDEKACKSYNKLHKCHVIPSDIRDWTASDLDIRDTDKYCYVMTYSFPCQDLSLAGKQAGMAKGGGTRSGLLWEVERLLTELSTFCDNETYGEDCRFLGNHDDGSSNQNRGGRLNCTNPNYADCDYFKSFDTLPQVLLMENVPAVASGKNAKHFVEWRNFLESLGYKNFCQVLNAKDYGIPQNRKRMFMISILGDYYYQFPKKQKLKLTLKDLLEHEVDEKYYVKDEFISKVQNSSFAQKQAQIEQGDIIGTLLARDSKDPKCIVVGKLDKKQFDICKTVYDSGGLAPTLLAQGNSTIAKVIDKCVVVGKLDNPHQLEMQNRVYSTDGLAPTLTCQGGGNHEKKVFCRGDNLSPDCRVRKLTPREYWRLMGFEDSDFDKVESIQRKTALYTQAGNSIVVDVLVAIFKEMI